MKQTSRSGRRVRAPGAALLLGLALLAAIAAAGGCRGGAEPGPFHCPMHPTYVADRQGDCPICGMRLVPVRPESGGGADGGGESGAAAGHGAPGAAVTPPSGAAYYCVMCQGVGAAQPGRCPECGMRLQPVPAAAGPEGAPAGAGVAGLAPVSLSGEAVRLAGVRTAEAASGRLARTIRTVGIVAADETRVHRWQPRTGGWIERLHVDFTGRAVRRGEPILSLYAPELLAAQEEYAAARAAADGFARSALPEVRRGGEELAAAARRRLELLGAPADLLLELDAGGAPRREVVLHSPQAGHVTGKQIFAGQYVEPGMELLTITDLSVLWVEAAVYENEAAWVAVGQEVALAPPHDPSARRAGRVAYINPELDPRSRTLTVRLDVANADLALKPGMYVDVELRLDAGEGILVPDDAILDTGARQVVFVESGPGRFAPRAVTVGARGDGRALVRAGLVPGERVAVQANFLLDSEARLRAAIGAAGGGGHAHQGGSSP